MTSREKTFIVNPFSSRFIILKVSELLDKLTLSLLLLISLIKVFFMSSAHEEDSKEILCREMVERTFESFFLGINFDS
jgi:hypothetical protein